MNKAEEDVLLIKKQLEKLVNALDDHPASEVLSLLKALADVPINIEILQQTRIGMTVNLLRKTCKDDEVVAQSKRLIKLWKKLLESKNSGGSTVASNSQGKAKPMSGSPPDEDTVQSSSSAPPGSADDSNDGPPPMKKSQSEPAAKQVSGVATAVATSDEVRLKCREMIVTSLKTGDLPDGTNDPEELSARIEDAMFAQYRSTSSKYMAAIRSKVFNLRDKRNGDLRYNVLLGAIAPKRFASMTPEEMASPQMKGVREKFTKDAINEHQMSIESGTQTDLFKCGKCKSTRCTYRQAQTRSADEPMTTFVFCLQCGNRWKFC